jgi:hypothetical protein
MVTQRSVEFFNDEIFGIVKEISFVDDFFCLNKIELLNDLRLRSQELFFIITIDISGRVSKECSSVARGLAV